jgi:hypothetical protein
MLKNTAFLQKPQVFLGFLRVYRPRLLAARICPVYCKSMRTVRHHTRHLGTTDGTFFPALSGTSPV